MITRKRHLVTATAVIMLVAATIESNAAGASDHQMAAPVPPATIQLPQTNPRGNFVTALDSFTKQIDGVNKEFAAAIGTLDSTQKQTPETKKQELTDFRNKLLTVEQALGPDAPFPQAVERFDSWISSQITRLNNQRGSFPSQSVVEELLTKYRGFHEQVAAARETIAAERKNILAELQDLSASETLAAEWLMVGDAETALHAMNGALDGVKALLEGINTKLHELNLTAARS